MQVGGCFGALVSALLLDVLRGAGQGVSAGQDVHMDHGWHAFHGLYDFSRDGYGMRGGRAVAGTGPKSELLLRDERP